MAKSDKTGKSSKKGSKKKKNVGGRPSKFTARTKNAIIKRARAGVPIIQAAQSVGIAKATIMAWLKKGREEEEGEFRDFLDSIDKAYAINETEIVLKIRGKAVNDGDLRAQIWLLEHHPRYRKNWNPEIEQAEDEGEERVEDNPMFVVLEPGEEASA